MRLLAFFLGCHMTVLTQPSELAGHVGKRVTLRGTVENSRIATLIGVDVESETPDLRGQPAVAEGVLEKIVVTQEQVDRNNAGGQVAQRGAGTYYRLVDGGKLARVRSP